MNKPEWIHIKKKELERIGERRKLVILDRVITKQTKEKKLVILPFCFRHLVLVVTKVVISSSILSF